MIGAPFREDLSCRVIVDKNENGGITGFFSKSAQGGYHRKEFKSKNEICTIGQSLITLRHSVFKH